MLFHYLRITFRYFLKHKVYNTLNILGLAFGLTVSLLLFFWLFDEISYDKFHENSSRIYRIVSGTPGEEEAWIGTPAMLAPELMNNYPEIESFVRIEPREYVIQYGDKILNETEILLTDSNFFQMFSYSMIQGSKEDVLKDINSIVLTQESATKFFGDEEAMNKILLLNNEPFHGNGDSGRHST